MSNKKEKFVEVPAIMQDTKMMLDKEQLLIAIFTSRPNIYSVLNLKFGKPREKLYIEDKVCAGIWEINFKNEEELYLKFKELCGMIDVKGNLTCIQTVEK